MANQFKYDAKKLPTHQLQVYEKSNLDGSRSGYVAVYLKNEKTIESFRRKYNIYTKDIKPHISLIYPFEIKNQKEKGIVGIGKAKRISNKKYEM